jgi:hypothetical protein
MSMLPPGGYGTIRRIGFSGYFCANAGKEHAAAATIGNTQRLVACKIDPPPRNMSRAAEWPR